MLNNSTFQLQMVSCPTKIVIPFRPMLLQITDCLNFHSPKYTFLDDTRNNVLISISERLSSVTHTYVGGPAPTIGESCERAARQATKDLLAKFNVIVEDVTASTTAEFEKCTSLYKLKYAEHDLLEKGIVKTGLYDKQKGTQLSNSKIVTLDYTTVLRAICLQLDLKHVYIDTVEYDPAHFTSFTLLDRPGTTKPGKCIVGDCCSDSAKAKNNLARKVVEYFIAAYNLEIVDANHKSRNARLVPVACALQRESFRTIRKRVLGIKEEVESSCFLLDSNCTTPRTREFQIPTLVDPPLVPRKCHICVSGTRGSVVPESRNRVPVYFNVPEPLETVFNAKKTRQ